MNASLTATVIICTRDRPGGVIDAATSVLSSTHDDTQVVIVDQSSDRRTQDAILPFCESGQVVHVPSPIRGLSRARNDGIRRATGVLIFFTDDDCIVPKDWVQTLSARFAADPDLGAVVAPVIAEHPWNDLGWTPTFEPETPLVVDSPREFPLSGMMGANMVFRKSALEAIRGFDVVLGPGAPLHSADDIDAIYRVALAGYRVAIDTAPAVIHVGLRRRANGDAAQHLRLAYRSIGAYYTKHVRCGDRAALERFIRQMRGASKRAPSNLIRNRGQLRVVSPLMMALGSSESLRFGVNRSTRLFVPPPVPRAAPVFTASLQ